MKNTNVPGYTLGNVITLKLWVNGKKVRRTKSNGKKYHISYEKVSRKKVTGNKVIQFIYL